MNAGMCTQILADIYGAEAVINTGIAGSLNNDVNIGDIVLSTDVLHHDMDAVGFGYKKGQIPQMKEFSFPADEKLRKLAMEVCREVILRSMYLKEEYAQETSLSLIKE